MLSNSFPLKDLWMTTGNFRTYFGHTIAGLCLLTEVRYSIFPPKSVVKTLLNILLAVEME